MLLTARLETEATSGGVHISQGNDEMVSRQERLDALSPLDNANAVAPQQLVHTDGQGLGYSVFLKAVAVNVIKPHAFPGRVFVNHDESRAGDGTIHTQPTGNALSQAGLARAQLAYKTDNMSGLQKLS